MDDKSVGDLFSILDFPANVLQGTEPPKSKYKSILERCHCFLLEELEPGCFLRDEEVSAIFESIREDVKEKTNRIAKNELLLEHLKKQPEQTIQMVLKKLEKRNGYIYRQLFPKTEKFQDIGKYSSKGNFLHFKVCSPKKNSNQIGKTKLYITYFSYIFSIQIPGFIN